VTTKVDEPAPVVPIEVSVRERGLGRNEAVEAFGAVKIEGFIDRLGMRGLNWFIASVIARHYPNDVFPEDGKIMDISWRADADYGPGLDPGVKWIALLRQAMKEVNGA
jgi:hypothetical protein